MGLTTKEKRWFIAAAIGVLLLAVDVGKWLGTAFLVTLNPEIDYINYIPILILDPSWVLGLELLILGVLVFIVIYCLVKAVH